MLTGSDNADPWGESTNLCDHRSHLPRCALRSYRNASSDGARPAVAKRAAIHRGTPWARRGEIWLEAYETVGKEMPSARRAPCVTHAISKAAKPHRPRRRHQRGHGYLMPRWLYPRHRTLSAQFGCALRGSSSLPSLFAAGVLVGGRLVTWQKDRFACARSIIQSVLGWGRPSTRRAKMGSKPASREETQTREEAIRFTTRKNNAWVLFNEAKRCGRSKVARLPTPRA